MTESHFGGFTLGGRPNDVSLGQGKRPRRGPACCRLYALVLCACKDSLHIQQLFLARPPDPRRKVDLTVKEGKLDSASSNDAWTKYGGHLGLLHGGNMERTHIRYMRTTPRAHAHYYGRHILSHGLSIDHCTFSANGLSDHSLSHLSLTTIVKRTTLNEFLYNTKHRCYCHFRAVLLTKLCLCMARYGRTGRG